MQDPFNLADDSSYQRWREQKLQNYPKRSEDLLVEVKNPHALSATELSALHSRCHKANMVFYATPCANDTDKAIPRSIARQLGLTRLDHNLLADEDGWTSLSVANTGQRQEYIPYTSRALNWHTDGYYNASAERIAAFQLHCVQPAGEGGDNGLLDHEIAYILLRDANPDFVAALMEPDAMTIPAREDEEGVARPAQSGPVFSKHADGSLHMRYTARKRSIVWKPSSLTLAAVKFLEELLAQPSPYIFHARLASGMGLICNNVLHDRTAFQDNEQHKRLIYRARFYDRVTAREGMRA